jgi:hypothetical protein
VRKRYGWWLAAATLITVAGVGAWTFWSLPSPPPEVLERFERIQIGMSRHDVQQITQVPELEGTAIMSGGTWVCSQGIFLLSDDWRINVIYDGHDNLTDKSLHHGELGTPWYRRAWYWMQQYVPFLPSLPF